KRIDINIAAAIFLDELRDVRFQRQNGADFAHRRRGKLSNAVDRRQRLWLGHRDRERVAHQKQGDRLETNRFFFPDQLEKRRIDQAVTKVASEKSQPPRERLHEHIGLDDALLDEQFAEHA